jgi:anti-sigma factor RsiW
MKKDLDDGGHESLTQAILARTSGSGCATARERLCDLVDDQLAPFDRSLVELHLGHCRACAALAASLAEATSALPSFVDLAPRTSVVGDVLRATSRRRRRPTFGERLSALVARAAERPRFSLEVAYVLTVLLLVALGNPVAAFKEASVRVQPRVSVAARAMSEPLAHVRAASESTLTNVERAIRPKTEPRDALAQGRALLSQFWQTYVDAPVRSVLLQLEGWAGRVVDEIGTILGAAVGEPPARPAR